MKKIPTLFKRDPDDMRRLLPEVTPGCEWVLAGEGIATRKYDGVCVRLTADAQWWARREVKPGKEAPTAFVEVDYDPVTDKRYGWEPIEQTGWGKFLAEADFDVESLLDAGTFELCGPKINGNPEHYETHRLVRHASAQVAPDAELRLSGVSIEQAYERLKPWILDLGQYGWEGVVWHHPDGRMAKLKARDFV